MSTNESKPSDPFTPVKSKTYPHSPAFNPSGQFFDVFSDRSLTKREYFAVTLMAAYLSRSGNAVVFSSPYAAKYGVEAADALIEQLNKD